MHVGLPWGCDDENRPHNCVGETEKALLVPVSTKGITEDLSVETGLANTVNNTHICFNDFIHS